MQNKKTIVGKTDTSNIPNDVYECFTPIELRMCMISRDNPSKACSELVYIIRSCKTLYDMYSQEEQNQMDSIVLETKKI